MAGRAAASPAAVWSALGIVYVVWGSTYLGIALTARSAPPLLALGSRFLVAAAILATVLRLRRGPGALHASRRELGGAALVGVMLLTLGVGTVPYAERHLATGVVALIVAVSPLWMVVIRAATGDRPHPRTIAGVALGLVGLAMLVRPTGDGSGSTGWASVVVAGAASWSLGSFLQPRIATPGDAWTLATYEMAAGGLGLVVLGAALQERLDLDALQLVSVAGWVYLVVVGSLIAYVAYVWLLGHAPLSLISTYAYVNPVVAVLLGVVLLAEPITSALLLGGPVIVLAVLLVVSGERASRPVPEPVG